MHGHVHDLRNLHGSLDKIREAGDWLEFTTYLDYWLSSLFVVVEGFEDLRLRDPVLEPMIAAHRDSLKLYRNATLHFQRKPDKHLQFHHGETSRLNWAEDLHEAFSAYFERHLESLGAFSEENA